MLDNKKKQEQNIQNYHLNNKNKDYLKYLIIDHQLLMKNLKYHQDKLQQHKHNKDKKYLWV